MRKRGGKLGSRQQPTCHGAGLDPAVFLEVAWYVLIGKAANTNLKKKKKKKRKPACLVMEFLSFQQDPSSIAHNYVQLSRGNYKQDPCAGKDLSGVRVRKSMPGLSLLLPLPPCQG